eukprot:6187731-Pleurochrysis_carterae.AAC.2
MAPASHAHAHRGVAHARCRVVPLMRSRRRPLVHAPRRLRVRLASGGSTLCVRAHKLAREHSQCGDVARSTHNGA